MVRFHDRGVCSLWFSCQQDKLVFALLTLKEKIEAGEGMTCGRKRNYKLAKYII